MVFITVFLKLILNSLRKLGKEKTPVVIHGGSGLSAETFTRLIELGGRKVNISTLVKNAYLDRTKELVLSGEKFAPIPFDTEVENAVKEEVKKHLEVFSGREQVSSLKYTFSGREEYAGKL